MVPLYSRIPRPKSGRTCSSRVMELCQPSLQAGRLVQDVGGIGAFGRNAERHVRDKAQSCIHKVILH